RREFSGTRSGAPGFELGGANRRSRLMLFISCGVACAVGPYRQRSLGPGGCEPAAWIVRPGGPPSAAPDTILHGTPTSADTGGFIRVSGFPSRGRRRVSRQDQDAIVRSEAPRSDRHLHACRSRLVNGYRGSIMSDGISFARRSRRRETSPPPELGRRLG